MADSVGLRIKDPKFWNEADLRSEIDRIFDICHSCRLCFKFCGSFPLLFELLDKKTEKLRADHLAAHPEIAEQAARRRAEAGEAPPQEEHHGPEVGVTYGDELPGIQAHSKDLPHAEVDEVVDLCFQCKLCYPNCPYTPPHEFALDFPRLLLRWKAHRVRRQGVPLRDKLIRDTALIGKVGSLLPGLTNWQLRNTGARLMMEKVTGIHRDKLMPSYHAETFPRWWRRGTRQVEDPQRPKEGIEPQMPTKVVLFSTCVVDYNDPDCGKAAVKVLEHNGIEVAWPDGQVCCGMPFLDQGDVDGAAKQAERNLAVLAPWVERGYAVVIPSPSCSLMIREEYPQLAAGDASDRIAANSYDLNDYIYRIAREGRLKRDFKRRFGKVTYHVPCHLRVQNIGPRARDLLKLVCDEVELVQECSGHDGTWSMRKEHFRDSLRWGGKAFEGMKAGAGEPCALACTDCRLAALHIEQGSGRTTVHPILALAHAYGFDVGAGRVESKPA